MKEISIKKLKELFEFAEKQSTNKAKASSDMGEQVFFYGMAIQANIFMRAISGMEAFVEPEIKETNIEEIMKNIGWN